MNDLAFLEKLLDLLSRSNAESIEIRKWGKTYRVSKSGTNSAHLTAPPRVGAADEAGAAAARAAVGGGSAASVSAAASAGAGGEERRGWLDIKSPMVGTFYARPEPGADPYVRVGSRISVGQTLCIIEAMKIMNPLDAEIGGTIREIAVEDAQPVEFGQVLFRVDPNG
jgi:acetyl-CoA carboxylase biotin carboxyl carrier protein